jgi:ATP-binding cassette subfamily B protein
MSIPRFLRIMLGYLRPYRALVILLLLGLVVDLAFEAALALSFKFLIDDAIVPRDNGRLVLILSALAGFAVVYALVGIGRDYLYARVGTSVVNDIRLRLFRHVQELPITLYERMRPGDITARFSGDLTSVESAIVLQLPLAVLACLGLVASSVILFVLQYQLALIAAIALPAGILLPRLLGRRVSQAAYALKQEQGRIADTVHENVSAQQVVKAFGLQRSAVASFSRQLASLQRIGERANFLAWAMERAPNLSILAVHLGVLWAGALLALDGAISVGELVAFNAIFLNVRASAYDMTFAIPELVRAAASYQRIEDLLDERIDLTDAPGAAPLRPLRHAITLRDVSFGYADGEPSLRDLSMRIPHGVSLALVGGSGSGKSTLIRLLIRFHDPTGGAILFDDQDARTVTQDSLRAQMGVVFQDNFLFNASIRENLRMARPDAADEDIERACRLAEIHDFIASLPEGYETVVGERGGRLSGGQRQRIAIARALVREPDILIFDEATSALDPGTEADVTRTLQSLMRGRTAISATHRLASITGADQIVVLDRGRLVEQGTHDELLRLHGTYRRLWDKQSGIFVSDTGDRATLDGARLRRVPLLAELDDELRVEVATALTTERYGPGEDVFEQGDPGDRFYMVARGKLEVLHVANGRETRVNALDDGDHFGEIALLTHAPRSATVRTLTPSILLSLKREAFLELVQRAGGARSAVVASMRERLERSRRLGAAPSDAQPRPGGADDAADELVEGEAEPLGEDRDVAPPRTQPG